MDQRKIAAWAGIIGPILFVGTFSLEGWLRPGYDPLGMFVSELALGPRGWIQNVNFVVYGTLMLLFAWGSVAVFRSGKASKAGPILLALIGISLFASGFFVMDPTSTLPDQITLHGRLHSLFGALVFSLSPISCFVFLRRMWVDSRWRSSRWWTLIAAVIITGSVVLMSVGPTKPPLPPNDYNELNGLIQRTSLITYAAWLCAFAWIMRKGIIESEGNRSQPQVTS